MPTFFKRQQEICRKFIRREKEKKELQQPHLGYTKPLLWPLPKLKTSIWKYQDITTPDRNIESEKEQPRHRRGRNY